MKISNKTKDIMLLVGILFVIFFALIGFCVAVVNCFAETNRQIDEYQSRSTIIRAETDEDREWNKHLYHAPLKTRGSPDSGEDTGPTSVEEHQKLGAKCKNCNIY